MRLPPLALILLLVTSAGCAAPPKPSSTARAVVVRDEPVNDASVAVAVDATDAGGEIAIPVGTMGPGDWSPRVSPWHCPCNSKEAWGGKTVCPHHAATCTRAQVEQELRCGFTRYSCGEYVVVRLPDDHRALDEPLVGAAFGMKSGKLVAVAEWDGHFLGGATCPCDGPTGFSFPDLDACAAVKVPCQQWLEKRTRNHLGWPSIDGRDGPTSAFCFFNLRSRSRPLETR